MKITVDCRCIDFSGIGVYLRGCLPRFLDSDNSFTLLGDPEKLSPLVSGRNNAVILDCRTKPFSPGELFFFPPDCISQINKSDLYYSPFFNVPCGRYKNPTICEDAALRQISNYLNSNDIKILNDDFEHIVSTAGKNSLIYFDPPYHSPDKTGFTGYQIKGFNEGEQERLRNVMLKMANRGGKCLLSNSDTEYIRKLYSHERFEIIPVQAKRAINRDPAGRGFINEVLIKNRI